MILGLIWILIKSILALIALFCVYVGYKMYTNLRLLDYYEKQGFTVAKGSRNLPKGVLSVTDEWRKAKAAMTDADEPLRPMLPWLQLQQKTENNLAILFGGVRLMLLINDVDAVQELYVNNNAQVDKTGIWEKLFRSFMGSSLFFAQADDLLWKKKRQAVAHAFYKDRLSMMLETLKAQILTSLNQWLKQIAQDGSVEINLASEVARIFSRFIVLVILGADIDVLSIDIMARCKDDQGKPSYKMQKMILTDAVEETFQQTMYSTQFRAPNPLYHLLANLTTSNPAFTEVERKSNLNCAALREGLRKYVRKRVSGQEKSKLEGQIDLLSLMMSNKDVFSEDFIIDELIDFLTAGTQSTQYSTQTILSHFALDSDSLKRVREEYFANIGSSGLQSFDKLTIESMQDLSYLGCVVSEALRYSPPAPTNSSYCLKKDTTIAGKHIKAGQTFVVNIFGLHYNTSQWQRPNEFLPDRFDPTSPLSRTPSGAKRHSMSFFPFNGGRRVCFGKTFAESVMRVFASLVSQSVDISFVDKDRYSKHCPPMNVIDQTHYPKLPVILKARSD